MGCFLPIICGLRTVRPHVHPAATISQNNQFPESEGLVCETRQRRCGIRHELLTQRALFCIGVDAKRTLSQHFVTRVVPPWIVEDDVKVSVS